MPDAVGNLFKTTQKNDREYGPAGQLLAVHSSKGTTRYEYDAEGNLVRKIEPNNRVWQYAWDGAGHMSSVIRPDGKVVAFAYDALGRRIRKTFDNKTTHWVWDGNNPLHEWVELKQPAAQTINAVNLRQQAANEDTAAIATRDALGRALDAQAPPSGLPTFNQGTQAQPITWLFEPDSFTPMAKLVGDEHYSIITDHLGTPSHVFDQDGKPMWSADISVWGELRNLEGDKDFCPFRYPGQYEDSETGLYYNRFRYYDPEAGRYVSQDPIGLQGGKELYAYVNDSTTWMDPFGLSKCPSTTRGANGEVLSAKVQVSHLDIGTGTATNQSSRDFARLLGNSNDDAGHILGKILGGHGGVGNVFPQLPAINRGSFREFEKSIRQYLSSNKATLDLEWEFIYNNGETRPKEIIYKVFENGNLIDSNNFGN